MAEGWLRRVAAVAAPHGRTEAPQAEPAERAATAPVGPAGRSSPAPEAVQARRERGGANWRSGVLAEEAVARHYEERGATVLRRRWRSPWGEVDLLVRDGAVVVAVEVKRARRHDAAAQRLTRRQMDRLCAALAAFCEGEPAGPLTERRLDLALVDGMGRVAVIPNAWGEDW